jgi:copper chaperone NosL
MKNLPRILFLTGSLLLLLVFAFPLWQITLFAPQYPDGITMYIWINQISGNEDGVLQNINILNHYIGMAKIEPESIPELQYFPYIIYTMVAAGIILFFVNSPKGFLIWSVVLMILGVLGIYDFYLWEYNYGHNLAPDAPIKIPGMVYQPPLFGRKMLLNFEAFSYPQWGSLFLAVPIILGVLSFWIARHRKRKSGKQQLSVKTLSFGLVMVVGMMLSSCSNEPVAIPYGEANCDHCQMTIVDQGYGCELVTHKGKVFMFDAIECMLHFKEEREIESWKYEMVTALNNPGHLMDVKDAIYLRSSELQSPMGLNITAFSGDSPGEEFSGTVYSWRDLQRAFPEMKPGQLNSSTQ